MTATRITSLRQRQADRFARAARRLALAQLRKLDKTQRRAPTDANLRAMELLVARVLDVEGTGVALTVVPARVVDHVVGRGLARVVDGYLLRVE
jgi:hypothetical protein